jgi:ArsR family transcriptional regulator, arsenate/arsenite/antimonite-responsive transcriptional repressor
MAEPAPRPLPVAPASRPAPAKPRIVAEPRNLTVETYRALADPIRLELLALIAARGPICVCHLEEELPYTQPRISKHLATLRRAGLVSTRRDGNWVYYSAELDGLDVAREFIEQLEQSIHIPHSADSC